MGYLFKWINVNIIITFLINTNNITIVILNFIKTDLFWFYSIVNSLIKSARINSSVLKKTISNDCRGSNER
jgi:hypothetical protein